MTQDSTNAFQSPLRNIETLAGFVELATSLPPGKGWIYRGQTRTAATKDWGLRPKAGRVKYSGNFAHIIDTNKPLEGYDLKWFCKWRKQAVAYSNDLPPNDFACLAYAQHYGLATRLLDWSLNPLVALYFAVNGDADAGAGADGAVYFYAALVELEAKSFEEPVQGVCLYQPPPFDRRLAAQQGVFTYHALPQLSLPVSMVASQYDPDPMPFLNLQEALVPQGAKSLLMRQLADVGITRKLLFPDLDGLSDYINWEVCLRVAGWDKAMNPASETAV